MTFASDETLAALLRESTAHKEGGRMADAVACLYQAKALMLQSPVSYPAESWCKLPLYLQQAGMFPESMTEFQFLLDDLPRRARRDAQLDNPNVGPKAGKQRHYQNLLKTDADIIRKKQALAQKRQAKK